jgi:hypothetical protein
MDWTDLEIGALRRASNAAGEYLEKINKTDLSQMTNDEWMTMMEVIVSTFEKHAIPF